jgi:hypothetical protein
MIKIDRGIAGGRIFGERGMRAKLEATGATKLHARIIIMKSLIT